MAVAAVMLVRDEADIINFTLDHLLGQVDHVFVYDNRSVDGTSLLLRRPGVTAFPDREVGYYQSRKTTALARIARDQGFRWVVPCDADEWWEADDGRTIGDWLDGVAPDVYVIRARLLHYVPTAVDGDDPDPFTRIRWRLPQPAALPKVCVRAAPGLTIHPGNHGADYGDEPFNTGAGLTVRHYSWRSADQYVRKIRNGGEAYAATDLPPEIGSHWRGWENRGDDAIRDAFYRDFSYSNPEAEGLVLDPAREESYP